MSGRATVRSTMRVSVVLLCLAFVVLVVAALNVMHVRQISPESLAAMVREDLTGRRAAVDAEERGAKVLAAVGLGDAARRDPTTPAPTPPPTPCPDPITCPVCPASKPCSSAGDCRLCFAHAHALLQLTLGSC